MKRAGKLSVYLLSLILVVFLTAVPVAAAEGESESGLSKDLVILFTSDVHCGVDQNFGLDGLYQVRKYYEDQGCYTLLVDDGDFIQGEPIGTMTKGEAPLELMNAAGYDIAIPGNHEFDYGMDQFLALTKKAKFPYISCNFNKDGKLVFNPYVIKEFDGIKFAFDARVLRMDNDTTSGKEGHYKILKAFGEKKADILVGTQMIAKGHDFPAVTLVGILDADMSLHFSDFRSGERTYQLLTQVAGRSGRAEEKGVVVLQTYSPENEVLRFATLYDYEGFYQNEIALREVTAFPPYTKIVRVLITGEDEKKTLEVLKDVYGGLEQIYLQNTDKFLFFNKMRSPIKRIQNKFRYQVLMRLSDTSVLPNVYDICADAKTRDVLVTVEENPANLS